MKAGKGSRPAPAERLSFRRGTAPLAGPFPFDPSRWQEVPWPRSHLTSSRDLVVTDQTPRERRGHGLVAPFADRLAARPRREPRASECAERPPNRTCEQFLVIRIEEGSEILRPAPTIHKPQERHRAGS